MAVLNVMQVFMCSQRLTEKSVIQKHTCGLQIREDKRFKTREVKMTPLYGGQTPLKGGTLEVTVSQEREEPVAHRPGLR